MNPHALTFRQLTQPALIERRGMNEDVLTAAVRRDDLMARSHDELSTIAMRLCYRLAKALEVWQHIVMPVCYLLEDKNGVTPLCSLEDVARKLRAMAQERTKRKAGSEVT